MQAVAAVRGVCSRTKESATAQAQENRIAFVTDDYDALLARKKVEVMDIWVPPALHHEFAIRDGREPRSGIDLAVECVNVIYAAYQSAETGYRVTLT